MYFAVHRKNIYGFQNNPIIVLWLLRIQIYSNNISMKISFKNFTPCSLYVIICAFFGH